MNATMPFDEKVALISPSEIETIYKVVVNHEDQYSIGSNDRASAPGWRDAGKVGTKAECLAYIDEIWT